MYICTLSKSQVSDVLYTEQVASFWCTTCTLHNFPFVHDVSRAITSEPWKSEKQTLVPWQTLQHLLDVLRGLTILDLCSEGTWTATSPHDIAKGVAFETRSEPPPSPVSMAVGSTPRAKRTCLLALMNVRNVTSPCLHFCCTNNRIIIFTCTNELEYEN